MAFTHVLQGLALFGLLALLCQIAPARGESEELAVNSKLAALEKRINELEAENDRNPERRRKLLSCTDGLGADGFPCDHTNLVAAGGASVTLNTGNTAFLLISSALVMLMTPGLGMFYGGMAGAENVGNVIMMSMVCISLVTLQWVLVGYSFAFGPGDRGFGSFRWTALTIVGTQPSAAYTGTLFAKLSAGGGGSVPHYAFVAFQCMFAQITPALISGAVAGRIKFSAYILFVLLWTTLVYDPLAHWVWALTVNEDGIIVPQGWIFHQGALDFAGGNVIHISSGFSALVACIIIGKRIDNKRLVPHNVPMVVTGASLLWFGWFGFNAGSEGAADGIAAVAFLNTHISASVASLTWMALEYITDKCVTAVGFSTGLVVGLVCITPGCGYVTPMASIAFGVVGAMAAYFFLYVKKFLKYDDTMDVFACHGIGGVTGALLTGLFAEPQINNIVDLDGRVVSQGGFYGSGRLLGFQVMAIVVTAVYASVGSTVILFALRYTIGLRPTEEVEGKLDSSIHGGDAYDLKSRFPTTSSSIQPIHAAAPSPLSLTLDSQIGASTKVYRFSQEGQAGASIGV
mmetsp:Transcript_31696/g.51145  ORF Transcript_31696/g.51145 Transcript_31696/m.51145 type:complete len:573 (+) Transcript_31696:148-1866(+)